MLTLIAEVDPTAMSLQEVTEIMDILRTKEGLAPEMRVADGNVAITVPLPLPMLVTDLTRIIRALEEVGLKTHVVWEQ